MLASACASTGLPIARKPAAGPASVALESWDPALSAALTRLVVSPTAAAHHQVALEYRRLGVLDQAHAHFMDAVKLDPHDASAFDALARIWRDWGFPERGIADAQRAAQLRPASASAANTVGTLFEAAGRLPQAREWYERALKLDPGASYALNNLCYSAVMLTQPDAIAQCRRAVAAAPGSRVARNNLGRAYAAAGDLVEVRELFDADVDRAGAQYNIGIIYMGTRQYDKALAAFTAAMQLDPHSALAAERATEARHFIEPEGSRVWQLEP